GPETALSRMTHDLRPRLDHRGNHPRNGSPRVLLRRQAMIYLSGAVRPDLVQHPRLGFLLTPDMGNKVPDAVRVAADNGCFTQPQKYTDARYMAHLEKFPRDRTLFAVAPDVFGSHEQTLERSLPVMSMIRALGLPAAFVAQEGWNEASTPWDDLDAIFIGGST